MSSLRLREISARVLVSEGFFPFKRYFSWMILRAYRKGSRFFLVLIFSLYSSDMPGWLREKWPPSCCDTGYDTPQTLQEKTFFFSIFLEVELKASRRNRGTFRLVESLTFKDLDLGYGVFSRVCSSSIMLVASVVELVCMSFWGGISSWTAFSSRGKISLGTELPLIESSSGFAIIISF